MGCKISTEDAVRDDDLLDFLDKSRRKWRTIPAGSGRVDAEDVLALSHKMFEEFWLGARRDAVLDHRSWYHTLYSDVFRGKRVLDVGCGLAIDGITFADAGAEVTLLDIVQENLDVAQRVCMTFMPNARDRVNLFGMYDLSYLDYLGEYDVIYAQGSLHHMPFDMAKEEVAKLLEHLPVDGRWVQLAYPKTRWERDGCLPFSLWGMTTDGKDTPWAEWYDIDKIMRLLAPAQFDVVLDYEFHNSDFIWFDLIRTA